MFIFVAYKDAPELSTALRRSSSDVDLAVEKTLLVNPTCPVRIMLEYIRKQCKLGIYTNFDLCDESGSLKGLFGMATYAYATDLFEHKKTYYVIVVKTEQDKRISILPQLNHENRLYLSLKDRCKRSLAGELSPLTTSQATSQGKATSPPQPGKGMKKK